MGKSRAEKKAELRNRLIEAAEIESVEHGLAGLKQDREDLATEAAAAIAELEAEANTSASAIRDSGMA
ncbi:MAG: hypothetical protein P8X50_16745 [Maritimibacter sp.]